MVDGCFLIQTRPPSSDRQIDAVERIHGVLEQLNKYYPQLFPVDVFTIGSYFAFVAVGGSKRAKQWVSLQW